MARDIERLLADLRAIRPGLDALVALSRLLGDGAALDMLWPATREFLAAWVLQPGAGLNLGALLDETLAPIASDEACRGVTGHDALAVIEQAIVSARIRSGRFGQPAVYIGTVAGAVGLEFTAVRVVDLSEGHLPAAVREDPVLPDRARREFAMASTAAAGLSTADDRALTQLHALDFVVRNASAHVALSAARLDITRSEREPSSVILEAAAAIGRPSRATGTHGAAIPDGTTLRRDFFVPAREADAVFRHEHPLGEVEWQEGVSRRQFSAPPGWHAHVSTDLNRIDRLMHAAEAGALDGLLGSDALLVSVPGLTAERPISPSRLESLLGCPHAFLLQHVLGFDEPAAPPPQREIGQPFYGSLFHDVAAEFYRSCGASFCAQEGTIDDWLDRADVIVRDAFERFLLGYPLTGSAVRAQERERLRRDIRDLIQYDWSLAAPGRRFVAVERPFGREAPVELRLLTGGRPLFVRGRIDRIDASDQTTLVRDLKTGRAHGRVGKEAGPSAAIDLQIAVYGMVARAHSSEWQIPSTIAAAYVYLSRGRSDERSYRDDFHQALEPAARGWLDLAGGLLAGRLFPRTPLSDDCQYCAFRPVCGDRASERAALLLNPGAGHTIANADQQAVTTLRAFAELKGLTASEGDGD
jgi:RecB family exonuclease